MKSYEERTKDNEQKIAAFQTKQKMPYEFKVKYAYGRRGILYHQAEQRRKGGGQPIRVRCGGALHRGYGGGDGKF